MNVLLQNLLNGRVPTRVYVGGDNVCRCGCAGNYHDQPSVGYTRALKRLEKMLDSGEAKFDNKDAETVSYLNFPFGDPFARKGQGSAITLYFDESARVAP